MFATRVLALCELGKASSRAAMTVMTGKKFRELLAAHARKNPPELETALSHEHPPFEKQGQQTRKRPEITNTLCERWARHTQDTAHYWDDAHFEILKHYLPCLNVRVLEHHNCADPGVFENEKMVPAPDGCSRRPSLNLFVFFKRGRPQDSGNNAHYEALSLRDKNLHWTQAEAGASAGHAGGGGVDSNGGRVSGGRNRDGPDCKMLRACAPFTLNFKLLPPGVFVAYCLSIIILRAKLLNDRVCCVTLSLLHRRHLWRPATPPWTVPPKHQV